MCRRFKWKIVIWIPVFTPNIFELWLTNSIEIENYIFKYGVREQAEAAG